MENLFENAKFGDKFVTREGRIVSLYKVNNNFARESRHYVEMLLEPNDDMIQGLHNYRMDGTEHNGHTFLDIVSRYQEEIDEDKLDEIAIKEAILHKDDAKNNGFLNCDEQSFMDGFRYGYIEGYKNKK